MGGNHNLAWIDEVRGAVLRQLYVHFHFVQLAWEKVAAHNSFMHISIPLYPTSRNPTATKTSPMSQQPGRTPPSLFAVAPENQSLA